MTTSERTAITTEEFVRPRSALAQIKRFCDEMAEQERMADQFHTLLAVDPDIGHMAAFPLENLASGSVFHAWSPLRSLSKQIKQATRQADTQGRLQAIEQIFATDAARIPLLTTIALAEYIFRWRIPEGGLKNYAILPPHEFEWDRARQQASEIAANWQETLPKWVESSIIQKIIGDETDIAGIAGRLLDQMPETLSVLFPSQLRADHAERLLHEMSLSGIVASLKKFPPALQDFSKVISSEEAKFFEDAVLQYMIADAMRTPALKQLSEPGREQAVSRLKKTLESDARVLTWLQQINLNPGNQLNLELDGKTKRLRTIFITASPRLWRAARQFGIAETCLRSPVAYLGEGRFFEWAFKELINDDNKLYATLRRGRLSQWLEPLVNPSAQESPQQFSVDGIPPYLGCVHEWERLMSHLATSLNLFSPTSGLQRAILEAKGQADTGRKLVEELAALLNRKVIDVSLRLSKKANVTGLLDPTGIQVNWRNLPPVELGKYPDAESVLRSIQKDDLANDAARGKLIKDIVDLSMREAAVHDYGSAQDYLQTILLSLLWMRMGEWQKARDVVKSAVGFVLSKDEKSITASAEIEHTDIRGDEALYLLAVTGRLAAKSSEDLVESQMALRLAEEICPEAKNSPRFLAEEQSRGVAELLFSPTSETPVFLSAMRLEMILRMFENEPWKELRASWQDVINLTPLYAESAYKAYSDSYALQQMYCAILMRYMLAYPPSQSEEKAEVNQHRQMIDVIFKEFDSLVATCQSGQLPCVTDSVTTTQIRAAYSCWIDPEERKSGVAGKLLQEQFHQIREQENESGASGMDQRRMEWMRRHLEKGWLI